MLWLLVPLHRPPKPLEGPPHRLPRCSRLGSSCLSQRRAAVLRRPLRSLPVRPRPDDDKPTTAWEGLNQIPLLTPDH